MDTRGKFVEVGSCLSSYEFHIRIQVFGLGSNLPEPSCRPLSLLGHFPFLQSFQVVIHKQTVTDMMTLT